MAVRWESCLTPSCGYLLSAANPAGRVCAWCARSLFFARGTSYALLAGSRGGIRPDLANLNAGGIRFVVFPAPAGMNRPSSGPFSVIPRGVEHIHDISLILLSDCPFWGRADRVAGTEQRRRQGKGAGWWAGCADEADARGGHGRAADRLAPRSDAA